MSYGGNLLVCAHESHVANGLQAQAITCTRCGRTSYNPGDVREGFCGHCHDWTSRGSAAAPPGTAGKTPEELARFQARDAAELARDAPPHEFEPHERQPRKCGFGWGGPGMFCGYLADHDRARAGGWGRDADAEP